MKLLHAIAPQARLKSVKALHAEHRFCVLVCHSEGWTDLVDSSRDACDEDVALFKLQQTAAGLKGNVSKDVGVQPAALRHLTRGRGDMHRHASQMPQLQPSSVNISSRGHLESSYRVH